MNDNMTADEIKAAVFAAISSVAPESDLNEVNPNIAFRDQVDIDSMDFLNIMIRIHEKLHVDIPEADYSKIMTLNGLLTYLSQKKKAA